MGNKIRIGAAQISPRYFDKEAALEKTCRYIEEGGRLGLDLLVFPEVYFGGYPYWRGSVSTQRAAELGAAMIRSAILSHGPEAQQMARVARQANVNCVVGCNELSDWPGSMTIYNSVVVISRQGRIAGRHRKLMPTHTERAYWGMGDASDIRVFDLDIGRVGVSICYEHHMTLLRAALAIKGEEIHCALWPGWWRIHGHLGAKTPGPDCPPNDIESAIRQHAVENQVFVVSCSGYLPKEDVPEELREAMHPNFAVGGSCVVNPAGMMVEGPVFGQESIVWAEVDMDERALAKAYFDGVGHYARPDLLSLNIRDEAWTPTGPVKLREAAPATDRGLQALLERYDVDPAELETILEEYARGRAAAV